MEGSQPTVTYTASGLPAGATFDPQTAMFEWATGYAAAGRCSVHTSLRPTSIAASVITEMSNNLTFWSGRDDVESSRRDFLTRVGFAIGASAVSACSRGLVQKALTKQGLGFHLETRVTDAALIWSAL